MEEVVNSVVVSLVDSCVVVNSSVVVLGFTVLVEVRRVCLVLVGRSVVEGVVCLIRIVVLCLLCLVVVGRVLVDSLVGRFVVPGLVCICVVVGALVLVGFVVDGRWVFLLVVLFFVVLGFV